MNSKAKRISQLALMIALAFTFSYLESLIPFNFGIPGIKLGLANLITVTALYTMHKRDAFFISVIRIILSGVMFSGAFTMLFSLVGGILSFAAMLAGQKSKKLSVIGVSVLGGVSHNIGQVAVAAVAMNTSAIFYYIPVLLISGLITGLLIGIVSDLVIKRLVKLI